MDQMLFFLGTDSEDKLSFWWNFGDRIFLTDGVIKKDFLETGLAQVLASEYPNEIKIDLQPTPRKRKKIYSLLPSTSKILKRWRGMGYILRPIWKKILCALRRAANGEDPAAFNARVKLFLGEKKFPSQTLKQVLLRYQERQ